MTEWLSESDYKKHSLFGHQAPALKIIEHHGELMSRWSSLTLEEHREYLSLQKRESMLSIEEQDQLSHLQQLVYQEQDAFKSVCAKSLAQIAPYVRRDEVEEILRRKKSDAASRLPPYFSPDQIIAKIDSNSSDGVLVVHELVSSEGKAHDFDGRIGQVLTRSSSLQSRHVKAPKDIDCRVIVPESALRAFIDESSDVLIPCRVGEQIVFDAPLCPRRMSMNSKNTLYYKHCIGGNIQTHHHMCSIGEHRVLVRSHTRHKAAFVYCHMDYFPAVGLTSDSYSEKVAMVLHHMFHPNCVAMRMRVWPQKSIVLAVEDVDIPDVKLCFGTFERTIEVLFGLSTGFYLLSCGKNGVSIVNGGSVGEASLGEYIMELGQVAFNDPVPDEFKGKSDHIPNTFLPVSYCRSFAEGVCAGECQRRHIAADVLAEHGVVVNKKSTMRKRRRRRRKVL